MNKLLDCMEIWNPSSNLVGMV